jgi:BirA family biotin operon repressor/biotin-[acetyl-CoA-carboxylase] ligase
MIWRVRTVEVTVSTNDDARYAAEAGEPEGLVVHSLRQTSGRGRQGRVWESPKGNLYCSFLLRPTEPPRNYGHTSFIAALALHDVVSKFLPVSAVVTLKWPNDVLVDGNKIAGILLEAGEGWLIIGIGLNVAHHPEAAMYQTTSLKHYGAASLSIDAIRDSLLSHLGEWLECYRSKGFEPIRKAWLERAQQGALTVKLPKETVQGTILGLDENGALRLRLADSQERAIASGDVFFVPEV